MWFLLKSPHENANRKVGIVLLKKTNYSLKKKNPTLRLTFSCGDLSKKHIVKWKIAHSPLYDRCPRVGFKAKPPQNCSPRVVFKTNTNKNTQTVWFLKQNAIGAVIPRGFGSNVCFFDISDTSLYPAENTRAPKQRAQRACMNFHAGRHL